ncbi:MAG: hypothetical protein FJ009_04800 [Chloroflexi bacterium]|nr:hypothetical protein [Chloroflexota bacterium]
MSIQMVIELSDRQGTQTILSALEAYKARLRLSIARTKRRLGEFEMRYHATTDHFLKEMAAEDLVGGDLEYVEWAGEAKLLKGLASELGELEHARYQLP